MLMASNPAYVRAGNWCFVRAKEGLEYALCSEQFDSDRWKKARVFSDGRTVRVKMVSDLMRRDDLIGMNVDQLLQLLGPPSLDPSDTCGAYVYFLQRQQYRIRNWYSWTELEYVVFLFENDRVTQVLIRNQDRIPRCSNAIPDSSR